MMWKFLFLLISCTSVYSQIIEKSDRQKTYRQPEDFSSVWNDSPQEQRVVSHGFGSVLLGQSLQEVKENLLSNIFFNYQGDPAVSFRPFNQQPVITIEANYFFREAQFQFSEDMLSVIVLSLNPKQVDYYTMFQLFVSKYGNATEVHPQFIAWEDQEVILRLERPLTVKYIAKEIFEISDDTELKTPSLDEKKNFFEQF